MKGYWVISVVFGIALMLGLSSIPAFADDAMGNNDPTPSSNIAQVILDIPVDCGVDAGLDVVALDVARGQSWSSLQLAGQILEINGFTLRTINIETGDIPFCVVKLMINNIAAGGSCTGAPYSPAAVNRVVSFVNNGGAAFINHENTLCDEFVDPISSAFGITNNVILGAPNPNVLLQGINFLIGNPPTLWNGVNGWFILGWTSFVPSAESVATIGNFPAGDGAMELRQPGSGCVLASNDSNWILDAFILNNDNQQLVLNAFLFLNECITQPIGGVLIPIDSTALLLAGAQMNAAWLIPVVAAGIVIGVFVIKRRK